MSDAPTTTAPTPPAPEAPAPRPPKKRRWRRRIIIALTTVAILVIALRITVSLALPTVLRKVAAYYGLEVRYERIDLSILGGDAGIWGLNLRVPGAESPAISAGYCRGKISVVELLQGRLHVWRAEVDGVDLAVERDEQGRFVALQQFIDTILAASPPQPRGGPVDLASPLRVDAFRLYRVRARLRDLSVQPMLQARVEMDVRVSELGSQTRPTEFEVDVWSDQLLDSLRIKGQGRSTEQSLTASAAILLRGLHARPLAPYAGPFGVRPVADGISARLTASVDLAVQPDGSLAGSLKLANLAASADGVETLAINQLIAEVDSAGRGGIDLGRFILDGLRVHAMRTAAGDLQLAGIALAPTAPAPAAGRPAGPTTAPATQPAYATLPVRVRELRINGGRLAFDDAAVSPAASLRLGIGQIATENAAFDPTKPDAPIRLRGSFEAPGIARSASFEADARLFSRRKTLDATFRAQGLRPEAIRPYLEALGLESQWRDASFECGVSAAFLQNDDGTLSADASITRAVLKDGAELLALDGAKIAGLAVDLKRNRVRVESVEVSGPTLAVAHEPSGDITAAGLRLAMASGKPKSPAAASTQPAAAVPASLPRIEIGKLTWRDVRIAAEDRAVSPPAKVKLMDAGVELADVCIDLDPAAAGKPGTIKAWLKAPGAARSLSVQGTVTPRNEALALDLAVEGEGLDPRSIEAYLQAAGIKTRVKDGAISLRLRGDVSSRDNKLAGAFALENVRWSDSGAELAGVDLVKVSSASVVNDELSLGMVEVNRPRAVAVREADGTLVVAGLCAPAEIAAALNGFLPAPPTTRAAAAAAAAVTPAAPPTTRPATLPAIQLAGLRVRDASLQWTDHVVAPAVKTTATVSLEMDNLILGRKPAPAAVRLTAALRDTLDRLGATGTITIGSDAHSAALDIDASGIHSGPLAPYLPPALKFAWREGRLQAHIDASLAAHPRGGQRASVSIRDVAITDGDAALLKLAGMRLNVDRLDLETAKIIAIDQFALSGLDANLKRTKDGAIHVAGVVLAPPPPPPADAAAAQAAPAAPAAPTTAPAQDAAQIAASLRRELPLFTLKTLDIAVTRLAVEDESLAAPLTLRNLSLRNSAPIELMGKDPASRPPVKLVLQAGVEPLMRQLSVNLQAEPFATRPHFIVDLAASGIRGEGILQLVPQAPKEIDASALTDGRASARVDVQLQLEQRGPADFDLSRPFTADLLLQKIEFRDRDGGDVLAGLEELRAEGVRVRPEAGSVHAKAIEITRPIARAYRDDKGVHAMGVLVKLPTTQPSTQPATRPAEQTPAKPQVAEAAPPATQPAAPADLRLDRLTVSGLDVVVEDRTLDPPLVVPLNNLDLEVRDLGLRSIEEGRPVRFSAVLNAGKAPLAKPRKVAAAGGLASGVAGAPAGLISGAAGAPGQLLSGAKGLFGGKKDKPEPETPAPPTSAPATAPAAEEPLVLEQRDLFSQAVASGSIAFEPQLKGWVKASVNGLELVALHGVAEQYGVKLGGGVFDGSVDARTGQKGEIDLRTRLVLTDLRISEPPDGPIRKGLKLPTPLDAAIVALEDADGSITVPARVRLDDGELRGIGPAALGAIGSVFAKAIASSPVKVVGGVTSMVGLDLIKKKKIPDPVTIAFAPGYAGLESDAGSQLDAVITAMKKNEKLEVTLRHEMGGGDLPIAQRRANPTPVEAGDLAQRLRTRKVQLLEARSVAASEARAILATAGAGVAGSALERLRSIDRELADTEDALDRLYDLLRPGAALQADRRARGAGIQVGRERLESLRAALLAGGIPEKRIRVINAQFNPAEDDQGGRIVATFVPAK